MKPNDPPQHLSTHLTRSLPHASPTQTAPVAPASVDDVPASVKAAVAAFVPPDGYEDFPMPTKNNLQRSLIYFFGRRVQSIATGKSQWFCLASPQCRANKTTISTAANISGCTRHLQVFHQLISPKTVHLNRKALGQQQHPSVLPLGDAAAGDSMSDDVETHEQLQDGDSIAPVETESAPASTVQLVSAPSQQQPLGPSERERALEWTIAMVVRNLLPIALVDDDRLVHLTRPQSQSVPSFLNEKAIRHHLVELFDGVQTNVVEMLKKEMAVATMPIFHLALVDVRHIDACCNTSRGQQSSTLPGRGEGTFLALQVSFISSVFVHEQLILDIKRFAVPPKPEAREELATHLSSVQLWIKCVLERFHISNQHIQSFVVDKPSSTGASALMDAVSTFLGRPREFPCVSACCAALSDAYSGSSESHLHKLITSLQGFVAEALDADFVDVFQGLEVDVQAFLGAAGDLDAHQSSASFWQTSAIILERVGATWDLCQVFFLTRGGENGTAPSSFVAPQLLREFTNEDIVQCISILHPLGRFFSDLETSEHPSTCTEAIIRMFALQQTTFNIAKPLQLVTLPNSGSGEQTATPDVPEHALEEQVAASVEHSEMTQFARELREEVSRHWLVAVREKSVLSVSAITCVFFHPCFRQFSFLDQQQQQLSDPAIASEILSPSVEADTKLRIHGQIKRFAREALQWKARVASSSASPVSASEDDDQEEGGPLKKRRLARHVKLNRQAEELARLGYLDAFASSPVTLHDSGEHDSSSSASEWPVADPRINREFERYLQNESVDFYDVPFDKVLPYWQRKAFDYPTLALIAQATLGHPASLALRSPSANPSGRKRHHHACVRCCFGGRSNLPWRKSIRDETQALEEITLFLHYNEERIESPVVRALSEETAAQVLASLMTGREREQHRRPTIPDPPVAGSVETPEDQAAIQV